MDVASPMLINAVEDVFHNATDLMVNRMLDAGPARLAKVVVVVAAQFRHCTVMAKPKMDVPVLARITARRYDAVLNSVLVSSSALLLPVMVAVLDTTMPPT